MKVLYITYDGLTDFIGQAQVLPYLVGSARNGHRISVISFEKAGRFEKLGAAVAEIAKSEGIEWLPQQFRSFPPYASKLLDQRAMHRAAAAALARGGYDILHCRSYVAALAGLRLKRKTGTPMIFDMRGFWPDSRREGGRWPDDNLLGSFLFRRWKKHEADMIAGADHIVALAGAAKRAIEKWPSYCGAPISVIPCCVDFETFKPTAPEDRVSARAALNIPPYASTLVYLGSLGTIYLLGEQLRLFDLLRARRPDAKILFIGRNSAAQVLHEAARIGVRLTTEDFRLVEAERTMVPYWLSAGDVGLCFYTPTFSSLGVSPTKLGEYLACGIPTYCNRGVGDVEEIVGKTGAGHVLPDLNNESRLAAIDDFDRLRDMDRDRIRASARFLDLPSANGAYAAIYASPERPYEVNF